MLCIYNCMEQQLFTIGVEQQSYDRIYVAWITRIENTGPRVVCYWNTSEVKDGKLKIHYERENKENQSNNAIKQTKWRKLNRKKRNKK